MPPPTTPPSPPHDCRPSWSLIEVAGHACDLYAPPFAVPGRAAIYLHGLHGLDGPQPHPWAGAADLRDAIEAAGLSTIAPRTGRSWWLDRIMPGFDRIRTPERFVLDEVRDEIGRRFGVQSPGIALIGSGMGGQGALRIAYRHPAVFPVAAALAPAIDFHLAMRECDLREDGGLFDTLWESYGDVERARQDTAILHVHPLNWPRHQWFASDPADADWHDGATRLASKLRALGIPHTAILDQPLPAAVAADGDRDPHAASRPATDAVRFILDALDQESRRLA